MSADTKGASADSHTDGQRRGIGLGYVIYQQVAGVLGAFALIAFLSHFWDIGWRGVLADLVGVWGQYVRPIIKTFFDVTIVAFLKWVFDWRIEVPLAVVDYFSVGFVMFLSYWRATFWVETTTWRMNERAFDTTHHGIVIKTWRALLFREWLLQVCFIVIWPIASFFLVQKIFLIVLIYRDRVTHRKKYPAAPKDRIIRGVFELDISLPRIEALGLALTFMPILYLALLLAANYLLLKPGT